MPSAFTLTSVTNTEPEAWRFSLSEISPSGVFTFTFDSAAWNFFWPPLRSPFTSFNPAIMASAFT